MKTEKVFVRYAIIWALMVALFNLIVFVTPNQFMGYNKFGGAFPVGFIFIILIFIGDLGCAYFALKEEKTAEQVFLNIPILRLSYSALTVTLVVGTLVMLIPNLPCWIGIIVCAIVFVIYSAAVIKARTAAEIVEDRGAEVKTKAFFIRSLTIDADSLRARAKTDVARDYTRKVYEGIRYSDPMSEGALAGIEHDVDCGFRDFSSAVESGSDESVKNTGDALLSLIEQRNKKCKLLK